MTVIIGILLAILTPAEPEALRRTAPSYLTRDQAIEHVVAARVVGAIYRVDPDLVLAIAWVESRYHVNEVTVERGGKVSCGVMTPVPTHDKGLCRSARASTLAGYRAGAKHLRSWLNACRAGYGPDASQIRCALLGYVGGYRVLTLCRDDAVARVCHHHLRLQRRAAWIRSGRTLGVTRRDPHRRRPGS